LEKESQVQQRVQEHNSSFWASTVTVRLMPWDRRPVYLSVTLVYGAQTAGLIKIPLGGR